MKDIVTKLLLGAVVLLLVLVLLRPSSSNGSAPVAIPSGAGRYQLVRANDSTVFLIDTQTGQCWSRSWGSTFASGNWSPETPHELATGTSKAP